MTFLPANTYGSYLPESVVIPQDQGLQYFLKEVLENYARFINRKETASYDLIEQVINQQYFDTNVQKKRNVFRKVFSFGAIAAGASLNIAHGITGLTTMTRLYGTIITDVVDQRPIPYADAATVTNQVSVLLSGINITVTNGATAPNITSGIAVIEYLKQ